MMSLRSLTVLLFTAALTSCGGGGGGGATTPPATGTPAVQSLTLGGNTSKVLQGGAPVALTATPSVAATVSWSLAEGPGTLSASSGTNVSYTPPASGGIDNTHVTISVKAGDVTQSFSFWVYPQPGTPALSLITGTAGGTGNLDGQGGAARFQAITDISADSAGNLLLVDQRTSVRRISVNGDVSTLATSAGTPFSVSVAPDNSALLLAGGANSLAVYKLKTDGSTTLWLSTAQTDQSATRVVAGLNGAAYLIGEHHVTLVAADGSSSLAGNETDSSCRDGSGASAGPGLISDAALDPSSGNLYLFACYSVRKLTPAGVLSTLAGNLNNLLPAQDGTGTAAQFGNSGTLTVSPGGALRVLDYGWQSSDAAGAVVYGHRLRQVTAGGVVSTLSTLASNEPSALAQAPGTPSAYRWLRYLPDGTLALTTAAQVDKLSGATPALFAGNEGDITAPVEGPVASARIVAPRWLTSDPQGKLYVLNLGGEVYQVARGGAVSKLFTDTKFEDGVSPLQILYRADAIYTAHVRTPDPSDKWQTGGAAVIWRRASDAYQSGSKLAGASFNVKLADPRVDGAASVATFYQATLLGFDSAANLYVQDLAPDGSALYRKITPDGVVSTVSALPADLGAERQGSGPPADGTRYVYDTSVGLVYRVAADGSRGVVAGSAGQYGIRLGELPGNLSLSGAWPQQQVPLTPLAPNVYALISGAAILQLVVP